MSVTDVEAEGLELLEAELAAVTADEGHPLLKAALVAAGVAAVAAVVVAVVLRRRH